MNNGGKRSLWHAAKLFCISAKFLPVPYKTAAQSLYCTHGKRQPYGFRRFFDTGLTQRMYRYSLNALLKKTPLKTKQKLAVYFDSVFEIHTRDALADGTDELVGNRSRELREGLDGVVRPEDLDLVADADVGQSA